MDEPFEIWRRCQQEEDAFTRRIRVFAMPDANFRTILDRMQRGAFRQDQFQAVDELIKERGGSIIGQRDFALYGLMQQFSSQVGNILSVVDDRLGPRTFEDLVECGFDDPDDDR